MMRDVKNHAYFVEFFNEDFCTMTCLFRTAKEANRCARLDRRPGEQAVVWRRENVAPEEISSGNWVTYRVMGDTEVTHFPEA